MDIYSRRGRELLEDEGLIDGGEAGFMEAYDC